MPPLLYNSLMGAVDAIAILALAATGRPGRGGPSVWPWRSFRSSWHWFWGTRSFGIVGLVAYGLFVHGSLLLGRSAILMGRAARTTAIVSAAG